MLFISKSVKNSFKPGRLGKNHPDFEYPIIIHTPHPRSCYVFSTSKVVFKTETFLIAISKSKGQDLWWCKKLMTIIGVKVELPKFHKEDIHKQICYLYNYTKKIFSIFNKLSMTSMHAYPWVRCNSSLRKTWKKNKHSLFFNNDVAIGGKKVKN